MSIVASFYRFTPLPDPAAMRAPLARLCCSLGVKGSILLAGEGVNGTIAGQRAAIDAVRRHLQHIAASADLNWKESTAADLPFGRLKVRLKREIVTMGVPEADPTRQAGTYVAPSEWNALIRDPDTVVIDTRNDYEVALGTFEGAIDPRTASFRDFPDWWRRSAGALRHHRIAMFCTGGIRCEKATSLLRHDGVREVYHLKGGILGYLEHVPPRDSLWSGACFVFDQRVAVGPSLRVTGHVLCHGCRRPLRPSDQLHPDYERGVACPRCAPTRSAAELARYRERQRQVDLAAARGGRHLGRDDQRPPSDR